MRIKVLGCGNLLSHDEGVGIHALRILKEGMLPPEVQLVEVGRPGLDFFGAVKYADFIIVIDATAQGDKTPGTVHRFEITGRNMEKILGNTIHGFNLVVPLKALKRSNKKLPPIVLLAVEIKERTLFGVGLSSEVKAGLEYLLDMALHEINAGLEGAG